MQKRIEIESDFVDTFRGTMLEWYDVNRRRLPWRAEPGHTPTPYHVWLSEVMLQQTTVPAVIKYFLKFINIWPTIEDLATADNEAVMREWAGLGYYARARNLHKCAKAVAHDLGGVFPQDEKALKTLPGIGEYTSAAIRSIAFDKPAVVIDGNIDRILARVFRIETPFPKGKTEVRYYAEQLMEGRTDRPGCFAQSLMDLGSMVCTPKSPQCSICPLKNMCEGHKAGDAETFPRKEPKKKKPHRQGYIYWIYDEEGHAVFHQRPEQGLLGGMLGLPTSEWGQDLLRDDGFLDLSFNDSNLEARHVFTHFSLSLKIKTLRVEDALSLSLPNGYIIKNHKAQKDLGLPTVFKKAYRLVKDL